MEILFWSVLFVISIGVLIKSADYFTDSAERIGLLLGLSSFIVGVTIVSLGTSLPELVVGIVAAFKGGETTSLVTANIVGSNITNILFVLGIAAVIGKFVKVRKDLVKLDLPLLSLATALFVVFIAWDRTLTSFEAVLAFLGYGVYLWYIFHGHPREKKKREKKKIGWRPLAVLLGSGIVLFIGATYTVESILHLGTLFHISPSVISLSVVALGTSLPELFVTLSAVRKKKYEVAVGNIFGSNIVNLLFVGAVPALITPLVVSAEVALVGLPFLVVATLLYVIVSLDREVRNYEGAMFLLLYIAYLFLLASRA